VDASTVISSGRAGKRHDYVLRDIEAIKTRPNLGTSWFVVGRSKRDQTDLDEPADLWLLAGKWCSNTLIYINNISVLIDA
jgi:hypothetical protein